MRIRTATIDDAPRLWQIRTDAIRVGCQKLYTADQVAAWTAVAMPPGFLDAIRDLVFLVGEADPGAAVGFAFMSLSASTIEGIFVDPSLHRSGVGTALLAELERRARGAGLTELRLSSTLNAEPFYARNGYRVVERTSWTHPDSFELPSVSMAKMLPSEAS